MKISNHKKSILVGIGIPMVLALVGTVGALNGWFGGGGTIPEDTMTRGLVGYWAMDEGSGQYAYDGSGNANNGTLGTGATPDASDPTWTTGKSGGALSFDGINDYIDCGTPNWIVKDFTMEAWVKQNTIHTGTVVGYPIYTTNDQYMLLGVKNNTVDFGYRDEDGVEKRFTGDKTLGFGWYHIVGVRDTSSNLLKIYANGELDKTLSGTTKTISSSGTSYSLRISKWTTTNFFHGTIDEVRIYNRALSAEEVRYHYNRGKPVAHWPFDEGSGTTAHDVSGNADADFPSATSNQPIWSIP